MNRKKLLIIIIATLAIIGIGVAIIIPIKTMGKRDTKTVPVTLSNNINANELSYGETNKTGSGIPLAEYNNKKNQLETKNNEILTANSSINEINSEPYVMTEAEKRQIQKWEEEAEESDKQAKLVSSLLEKYYKNEYEPISKEIKEHYSQKVISIQITDAEVREAELVVKLYKEQNLSKEEKEAVKHVIEVLYKKPSTDVRLGDNLMKEMKKILEE